MQEAHTAPTFSSSFSKTADKPGRPGVHDPNHLSPVEAADVRDKIRDRQASQPASQVRPEAVPSEISEHVPHSECAPSFFTRP